LVTYTGTVAVAKLPTKCKPKKYLVIKLSSSILDKLEIEIV